MTRTVMIMKAMQAVLLATVLTPATVNAEPLSTRQMLAQAQLQSQNEAVKDEVKRIDRGLTGSPAEAATDAPAQRPLKIPPVSAPEVSAPTAPAPGPTVEMAKAEIPALPTQQIETPSAPTINNNIETAAAAAPATASMQESSIVTLPKPAEQTAEIVPSAHSANVETVGPATNPAPVTLKPEAGAQTTAAAATSSVEAVRPTIVTKVDTAKVKPTAKNNMSTKTASTQSSNQHRASGRGGDSFSIAGFTVSGGNGGQLTKLMNRPEVKSMLAQYGVN